MPKGHTNNPHGRPKGARGKRAEQWEALAESITGLQAEKFCNYINKLWDSKEDKDHEKAAGFYLQTVEYFKPKQSRIESNVEGEMVITVKHE